MHTEIQAETNRVIVIDNIQDDVPQAFTVCVKDPTDWEEMHNYIINENEVDGIPNRKIDCSALMPFSNKRAVYEMSVQEAEILRQHPKIEWVEKSSMYNNVVLEQRKYDEDFDRHVDINRYKIPVTNRRISGDPTPIDNSLLDFTQWGIYRHQCAENQYVGSAATTLQADSQYTLTGKNVDIVIMDTGVRWDHPEFLKPGYTSVPVGVATETVSRVRDILIHGQEEYGINWAAEGLTAPGSGILANYTKSESLNDATFNGSWHGSHVAGTAAGNQFGIAFEANIWSIACIDRSDLGWAEPSDGFDYIRVWHKNKPINPETGRKNPTIVNCSWGHRQFVRNDLSSTASYRNSTFSSASYPNAITFMDRSGSYYEFTTKKVSGQTTMDELLDDPECQDIIFICSAGNSGDGNGKQDIEGGLDYENAFLSGSFYYSTSQYDSYYCRAGTPAIGHAGEKDAVISVGSLDSGFEILDSNKERKSSFSNCGPKIDVWSAGSTILSPWSSGYNDPRNFSYFINYLSGTSMASPNVTGVMSLYLQSNPSATRVDARRWLLNHGTKVSPISDRYPDPQTVAYWDYSYALRDSTYRILYNPFANNNQPKMSGVKVSGISFTQS